MKKFFILLFIIGVSMTVAGSIVYEVGRDALVQKLLFAGIIISLIGIFFAFVGWIGIVTIEETSNPNPQP